MKSLKNPVLMTLLGLSKLLSCAQSNIEITKLEDETGTKEAQYLYVKKQQDTSEDFSLEVTQQSGISHSTVITTHMAQRKPLNNHPLHQKLQSKSAPASNRTSPKQSLRQIHLAQSFGQPRAQSSKQDESIYLSEILNLAIAREKTSLVTRTNSVKQAASSSQSSSTITSTPATSIKQTESIFIPDNILYLLDEL